MSVWKLVLFATAMSCTWAMADVTPIEQAGSSKLEGRSSVLRFIGDNFGVNYNSFFYGPGPGQPIELPPGNSGQPSDTGLNFFNLISVKWKATPHLAVDLQFRNQLVVTNGWEYRHQGQRLGISGTFLKGNDWSLSGALNSDIPISAIMGQIPSERTLIFNPGTFATFNWAPSSSRWSLFALLTPRIWFYRDRNAISRQDALGAGTKSKPEWTIYLNPSVNYAINDDLGLRLGTTFEYTKFVGFDSARRNYMPMEAGITYNISKALSVYAYVLASTPLDNGLRQSQGFGNNSWTDSISANLWLSGTLF